MENPLAPGLRIVRPANVPLFRIDGLCSHKMEAGLEFTSYFTLDHLDPRIAIVCCDLVVRPCAREQMRKIRDAAYAERLALMRMRH